MPLPFMLGGLIGMVAAAATALVIAEVDDEQNKKIESGKNEVLKRVTKKIDSKLVKLEEYLEEYEVKIRLQFYISVVCFFVFPISLLVLEPLAWLIAIIVAFISMNLFSEFIALYLYKDAVKDFRKIFWQNWKKNKFEFTLKIIKKVAKQSMEKSVKKTIHNVIKDNKVDSKIRKKVDEEISKLGPFKGLSHGIFGDSRSYIVQRIYREAINEIDYDNIMKRVIIIILQIVTTIISCSIIAFFLRLQILGLFDIGWLKWIILLTFFGTCFWRHKQRILFDTKTLSTQN